MTGRSVTYRDDDATRDAHYLATVEKVSCPMCLSGLAITHGIGRDPQTALRLGSAWWNPGDVHPSKLPLSDAESALMRERQKEIQAGLDDDAQMQFGYWSVWTMVDGALDEEEDIPPDRFDSFVEKVEQEAAEDGLETALYVLWHEHAPITEEEAEDGAEDVCIQYAQDLRPFRVWNSDQSAQQEGR